VIRVYGSEGSLEWAQEHPDYLNYTPRNQATQVLSRGTGYIQAKAGARSRIPSGHPEGIFEAFANLYQNVITSILKLKSGQTPSVEDLDFSTVEDGLNGVKFVHAVIDSANADSVWITLNK
jgi:predicted dehydrogenase